MPQATIPFIYQPDTDPTQGSILHWVNGRGWVHLSPGTAGYSLVTGGSNVAPSWTNAVKGSDGTANATAGDVGEYVEDLQSTGTGAAFVINEFNNLLDITITAGDWDVTGIFYTQGAVSSLFGYAVSVNSGNTTTDHVSGSNQVFNEHNNVTHSVSISCYRLRISATTTVYGKVKQFTGASGDNFLGRLSARRVR